MPHGAQVEVETGLLVLLQHVIEQMHGAVVEVKNA
jgi:hypothetical protein